MRIALLAVAMLTATAIAAEADEWKPLLKTGSDSPWQKVAEGWIETNEVKLKAEMPNRLEATKADKGEIWVNGELGRVSNLVTKETYGDCEVHVEFLIAKRSNSGIKFHALYEIQILDSAGKPTDMLTGNDCGGIYPRAENKPKYHHIDKGVPPKTNSAKPAGEWQTLDVVFQAARFDAEGKKMRNARIVKAVLNGEVIHENVELLTPTGANYVREETATGPFMLQADHGPVAFRNVKIRAIPSK
jgi:hypothetical protein